MKMKKLLFSLVLFTSVTVQAAKIQDVPREQIDYFEITHSLNTICVANFLLKESQDVLIQKIVAESDSGKFKIRVSEGVLEKSNYALLEANCGLSPSRMMFEVQDLLFEPGKAALVPAQFQLSVVLKNGERLEVTQHHSEFKAQFLQDIWGNQDVVIEKKPELHLDMVKFKN
jgi:hypothetical protein